MDVSFGPELFQAFPEDYLCPCCHLVLQEPHLMSCCGAHLCKRCIVKFENNKRYSPCCHEEYGNYTTLLDKGVERKIEQLQVWCLNRKECEWSGTLEDLKHHLDQECLIQLTACPNQCGGMFPRRLLTQHQLKQCSSLPLASHENDSTSTKISRSELTTTTEQDDDDVRGLKKEIRTQAAILKDLMSKVEHIEQNIQSHALEEKLVHIIKTGQQECIEKLTEYQKEIEDKLQKQQQEMSIVTTVNCEASSTDKTIEYKLIDSQWPLPVSPSSILLPLPPCMFTMQQFETYKKNKEEWFSPALYSSHNGYRFVVGILACGVDRIGKDTHISLKVYLAKGEHDGKLNWPFLGHLSISLLNWRENHNNIDVKVMFDNRAKVNGLSDRVTKGERAITGNGYPRFINNDNLCFNRSKNTEYLRNDTLCFCVSEIYTDKS